MPRTKRSSCAYIAHQAKLRSSRRGQRLREKERDALRQIELVGGEDIEYHDYIPLVPQNREEPKSIVTLSIPEDIPRAKKPTASLARKFAEKLRKQRRRQDPEYRKRERERDALRKQQRRKDPVKRRMENERAAERRRIKRKAERERKQLVSIYSPAPAQFRP